MTYPLDRRTRLATLANGDLGRRSERQLSEGGDREPEEQVAHRRVADDDRLDDRVPVEPEEMECGGQLAIQHPPERPAKLAGPQRFVGDPGDDIAAAEALRILEGERGEDGTRLEVDELGHDARRADVQRQPDDRALVSVERRAEIADQIAVSRHRGVDPVERDRRELRGSENPEPAAQHGELDVLVRSFDDRLAGEPEAVREMLLRRRPRAQRALAAEDLDDAFPAAPALAAGGRDRGRELGRFLEQRAPRDDRPTRGVEDDVGPRAPRLGLGPRRLPDIPRRLPDMTRIARLAADEDAFRADAIGHAIAAFATSTADPASRA